MQCKKCLQDKPSAMFYLTNRSSCKDCVRAAVRANRAANRDYYVAFDKARAMTPKRVEARIAYQETPAGRAAMERAKAKYANSPQGKANKLAWTRSEAGKASHAAACKAAALRNPDRHKARTTLGNAVRDGKVIPWPVCAVPECCGKPQGHHPDYSRPLDVVWLCSKHHREAHQIAEAA